MSTDRLSEKLEGMDKRRDLRARRLSLTEGLEILSDLRDAGDGAEAHRWYQFVMEAHDRGDFRWTFELNRREWSAVMFGRVVPTWSLPEMTEALARLKLGDPNVWRREAKAVPLRDPVYAEIKRAGAEGRIMSGPGGKRIMFRSMTDPLRDETPEEMGAALDRKVAIIQAAVAINERIDDTLARVEAKLVNGERVIGSETAFSLLEDTINRIASIPSGAFAPARSIDGGVRLTDGAIPKWSELLRAYEDFRGKVGNGRANRAVELTRNLDHLWDQEDTEARALGEQIVGSADLPAELFAVERGLDRVLVVSR